MYSSQQTSGKANDLKMRKQIGKVSNEPKGTAQKQQVVFKVKSNTLQSLDFCGTGNYLPDADTSHRVSKARLSYSAVTDTAEQPLWIRVAHGGGASVEGLQASPGDTPTWRPHRKECAGIRHQCRNASALLEQLPDITQRCSAIFILHLTKTHNMFDFYQLSFMVLSHQ